MTTKMAACENVMAPKKSALPGTWMLDNSTSSWPHLRCESCDVGLEEGEYE